MLSEVFTLSCESVTVLDSTSLTTWWSLRAGIPSFDRSTPGFPGRSISS